MNNYYLNIVHERIQPYMRLVVNGQKEKRIPVKRLVFNAFLFFVFSIESFRHNMSGLWPRPNAGPVIFNIIIKETFS